MQVSETLSEGLKRQLKITIPAAALNEKLAAKMEEVRSQARLPGFRPGKVPLSHVKRMYGRQLMVDIINEELSSSTNEAISARNERPATQPKFELSEEEGAGDKLIEGEIDLDVTVDYEILPEIEVKDHAGIAIERPVVEVSEDLLEKRLNQLTANSRPYEPKSGDAPKAEQGDKVTISFVGKINGEPFDGGSGEGIDLVIGSGQFIPGFEEQLEGVAKGEEKLVEVSFPEEYAVAKLAGQPATFEVTVTEVAAPGEFVLDDAFAQSLGVDTADKLRELVREQMVAQYDEMSRRKAKRRLLDELDKLYDFDLPEALVSQEFDGIWATVRRDEEAAGRPVDEASEEAEKSKADYRRIAERRVRLGLLLAEIGNRSEVDVTEDELREALMDRARQNPGREQQVFEFYRKNPEQIASLRAPIFEEKVVDLLFEAITVSDKAVTPEELEKPDDEDA
ncbi:MAG: trigger factor [Hyphomicrobiaceae bacterium]|nr:trigger factor [Hyphomicrobiaceae bacterium]